jgi:HEPN domain-containing protein
MALPRDIDARRYYRVAKQRLEEAKAILRADMPSPAEYLGGYSIECILKALVITVTSATERPRPGRWTVEWLKKEYGHDLENLRSAVRKRGVNLPPDVTKAFVYVLAWDPDLRYEPGPVEPAKVGRFLSAAEVIVRWADGKM